MALATAERSATEYSFLDKPIPEKVFNSEVRRIDQAYTELKTSIDKLETKVDRGFESVNIHFNKLEQSIDARFEKIDARFVKVDERFERLETKIDARFECVSQEMNSIFRATVTLFLTMTGVLLAAMYAFFTYSR
jgi:predicted  nucleic acid-binding Zn-ribbon protein